MWLPREKALHLESFFLRALPLLCICYVCFYLVLVSFQKAPEVTNRMGGTHHLGNKEN